MNYIELINNFWRLNKEYSFTPNEKALYFAILNKCNELGWKNPFNQSSEYLAIDSGMSISAMKKARNILKQLGLIDFDSGNGRRNNSVYKIKGVDKGVVKTPLSDPLSDPFSDPLSDPLSGQNRSYNNKLKTKLKETKLKKENVPPLQDGGVGKVEDLKSREVEKIDFPNLLKFINKKTGRNFKVVNKSVRQSYNARLKDGYTKDDIMNSIRNSVNLDYHKGNNFQYLTPEFFSRAGTLDKYSNVRKVDIQTDKPKSTKLPDGMQPAEWLA